MRFLGKRALVGALAATALTISLAAGAAHAATDDEFSDDLWNLQQIKAEQAWPTSTGDGVVVAVVDSGVDLEHPDLQGQLVPGITTIGCGEQQATCGDGDWVGPDGEAQSADRHGTHVAGTIAATANNGLGVAGVAPGAKVMPVKSLDNGSGTTVEIAEGIRWATDHGADVINMSLGGLPGTDLLTVIGVDAWTEAVAYAIDNGVVVVAAAGNSTYPFCSSPANVQGVLCVTSTDRNKLPAYYSNLGLRLDLTGDTVAAPGGQALAGCAEDVLSTVPVGTGASTCGDADHDAMAGTSMASPAVAGLAALLVGQCRDRDNVVTAIKETARVPMVGKFLTSAPWYGEGIVDAEAAVKAPGAGC